jgi:two-component system, LytTR family, sensor kinase
MQSFDSTYTYQAQPGTLARSWWLKWLSILGVWAVLGVIYAGPIYMEVRAEGMNHAATRVFSWGILTWCAWAPLTPLMILVARRFSLVGPAWKRGLLAHVPAFLIISAIHSAAATAITLRVKPFDNMGSSSNLFWPRYFSRMKGAFGSDLLIYGAVIGVCYAFDYYRKYREREFLAAQLETQLAQAQLDSLRTQLHPHFLFNTLNGIVGLVRDQKNETAVNMLVGLSDLLRHALEYSNQQEVELRDEINFLELYLNLQQMRFSDRLQIKLDIDPRTRRALVPSLILQPLAENALRHGIGHSIASGLVGVSSRLENGSLKLKVFDNGVGLSPDWQLKSSGGIGLANTAARLQQLYNGEHRLDIQNRPEGGVEVVVVVPFRTNGNGDR